MSVSIPDTSLLYFDKISLQYSQYIKALDSVSLELKTQELISIVGPSGCGKSTLLKIAAQLLRPSSGQLRARGNVISQENPSLLKAAYVFQSPNLLPWRRVIDNVTLPLELLGVKAEARIEKAQQVLQLVGLRKFMEVFPGELSGGMRMRASLARALVTEPELLLLDEPFASLDELTRQSLQDELLSLMLVKKWSALFVTHSVLEAVYLSRRVLVMSPQPGRILATFDIPFDYPRHSELRTDGKFVQIAAKINQCLSGAF